MTSSAPALHFGDQLNPFLRFQISGDPDAAPLSMLSALARLDLDPWREAAELARLPRESAARRLGLLLAALPGAGGGAELEGACRRSVRLLPTDGGRRAGLALDAAIGVEARTPPPVPILLLILVVVMMTLSLAAVKLGAPAAGVAPAAARSPIP